MSTSFAITAAAPTVSLGADRTGTATFTVSNTSGVPQRGRARPVAADPAMAGWLSLDGPAERDFPIEGTEQLVVRISIPPATPAGVFRFRLDIVSEQNPDEQSVEGPSVSIDVPALAAHRRSFPWWAIAAPAAVLVLVIGFFAFRGGGDDNVDATEPTENPLGVAPPVRFSGQLTVADDEEIDLDQGATATNLTGGADLRFTGTGLLAGAAGPATTNADPDAIRPRSRVSGFVPLGGTVASTLRTDPQGFQRCVSLPKSSDQFLVSSGLVFCVVTGEGRIAELRLVANGGGTATLEFTTFELAE